MHVYEKVRMYIDSKGIRQVTVAKNANLSVVTFNAMMNGKRVMYADDLRAICCALNVSPEMFIEVHNGQFHSSEINATKEKPA